MDEDSAPRTYIQSIAETNISHEIPLVEMVDYLSTTVNSITIPYLKNEINRLTQDELLELCAQMRGNVQPASIIDLSYQYIIPYFSHELSFETGDFNLVIAGRETPEAARLMGRGYAAYFSYPNNIVISESLANLKTRIKGWLIGLEDIFPSTVEECVEHECRHGFFEQITSETTNMVPEMNEGFALATMETTINYPSLPDVMDFDIEKISAYRDLFLLAQAKGCDEVALLQYIYDKKYFGTYYDEKYDYTEPAPMPKILKMGKKYVQANASKRVDFNEDQAIKDYRQELYVRRTKWHYQIAKQFSSFIKQKYNPRNRQSELQIRYKDY
jgi:hypothetical protein